VISESSIVSGALAYRIQVRSSDLQNSNQSSTQGLMINGARRPDERDDHLDGLALNNSSRCALEGLTMDHRRVVMGWRHFDGVIVPGPQAATLRQWVGVLGKEGQQSGADTTASVIPLTPEMIRELGKRFGDNKRAQSRRRRVRNAFGRRGNVSFAGAGLSPSFTRSRLSDGAQFFDKTGEPWPIMWDTNSNPAGVAETANCNGGRTAGAHPSGGWLLCLYADEGSNVLQITPMSAVRAAVCW